MATRGSSTYVLLSRPGCHLCVEMKEVLESVLSEYGQTYVEELVDARPDWRRRYGEVIPVLLRDGRAVAKIRVDRDRLVRIVRRARG